MSKKVAIVTGSNKGIGFAIVKGLLEKFDGVVYLTSRDEGRGKAAVSELNKLGLHPEYHQLDVSDRESVIKFSDHIKNTHGGIDILINNAAIANSVTLHNTYEESIDIININFYSILTIQEFLFPLVRDNGRILNISSDCGHISNLRNKHWIDRFTKKDFTKEDVLQFVSWYSESAKNGTWKNEELADDGTVAAYRIAKMALSAMTILQQKELASRNISVNSMHPGLVRSDMTGGVGFYSIDDAAKTPIYLVLEAPQDLKGAYIWYDGKVLDWYDYNADYFFKSKTLQR